MKKALALAYCFGALSGVAFSGEVWWRGGHNSTYPKGWGSNNGAYMNFVDGAGSWRTFVDGDSAYFTDDAAVAEYEVQMVGRLTIADWVVDSEVDYVFWGGGIKEFGSFEKSGSGACVMSVKNNRWTGPMWIRGGEYAATAYVGEYGAEESALGNLRVPHRVLVSDGATLRLGNMNNSAYSRWTVLGTMGDNPQVELVISNGVLKLDGGHSTHVLGPVSLYDAELRYEGMLCLGSRMEFAGTRPYVLTNVVQGSSFMLGYGTGFEIDPYNVTVNGDGSVTTNRCIYRGRTVFDVADITQDGADDVTFEISLGQLGGQSRVPQFKMEYGIDFACGVEKTGAGTLCLAGNNSYTGKTEVAEGVLKVTGSLQSREIVVKSGAYLGGNGTIRPNPKPSVRLEEGAGFVVNAENVTERLNVWGSPDLPEVGSLYIVNYTGNIEELELTGVNPFPNDTSAAEKAAIDAEHWTAVVAGYPDKLSNNLEVLWDGSAFSVRYVALGTRIFVR